MRTSVHNGIRGGGGGSTLVTAFGTFVGGITRRGRTPRRRRHRWSDVMAVRNRLSVTELGRWRDQRLRGTTAARASGRRFRALENRRVQGTVQWSVRVARFVFIDRFQVIAALDDGFYPYERILKDQYRIPLIWCRIEAEPHFVIGRKPVIVTRQIQLELGELYFLLGYGTGVKLHAGDEFLLVVQFVVIWYDLVAPDEDVPSQPERVLDLVDELSGGDRYHVDVRREQTPHALVDLDEAAPLAVDGDGAVVEAGWRLDDDGPQEEGGCVHFDGSGQQAGEVLDVAFVRRDPQRAGHGFQEFLRGVDVQIEPGGRATATEVRTGRLKGFGTVGLRKVGTAYLLVFQVGSDRGTKTLFVLPVLQYDDLLLAAAEPRVDVLAQFTQLLQADGGDARLQVEYPVVLLVLLFQHLDHLPFVFVGEPRTGGTVPG